MKGQLIGLGTGPGDPELLTLKALRALQSADVIAHFTKRGKLGNARATVSPHWPAQALDLPLVYPVTVEIDHHETEYQRQIDDFFDASAALIADHLEAGRNVVILSAGDPLFYGSYMHLHVRLSGRYPTQVIPGVTGMSGCWSAAGVAIAQGEDVLSVLPGTLKLEALQERLSTTEACVIMKVGRNLAKIREALRAAGRLDTALYVERASTPEMRCLPLSEKTDDKAPYFSIVLVPGWEQAL
ncbi:Precorrin-2 C(20)-methyltransferase [gamma proteobacterium HdN1]|nr:Precorrin-2 C(20)-methyltransferase [gamma proteobacterium HdN1]